MKVDALTNPGQEMAFKQNVVDITQTCEVLGMGVGRMMLFGTAGMAQYGLDAHARTGRLDVDAYVSEESFIRLRQMGGRAKPWGDGLSLVKVQANQCDNRLSFTGFCPVSLQDSPGKAFWNMYERADKEGPLPTVSLRELVNCKVRRGLVRDYTGVFQAHSIGTSRGNPVVERPEWRSGVATAIRLVRSGQINRAKGTFRDLFGRMPGWMRELQSRDFDHPAFAGLSEES